MLLLCRFADEDSDQTILFDEPEGEEFITGPGPLIKGGTIHKLVERLTYHEYAGKYNHKLMNYLATHELLIQCITEVHM